MKNAFLIVFGLCFSFLAFAQTPTNLDLLKFSVSQTTIDRKGISEKPAFQFEATYAKQLTNKRTRAEISLGYMDYFKRQQYSHFPFYYKGDHSQRVSTTVRLLYNLLSSSAHSIHVGGGLSGWYQKDNMARDLTVFMNSTMSEVTSISFERVPYNRVSMGYVLTAEYNYSVTSNIVLGAKIEHLGALIYPYESAIPPRLSMAGFSIGYRF